MEASGDNRAAAGAPEEGRSCAIPWFEEIKQALSKENRAKLGKSCFGKFFNIKALILQDEIYIQLLKILDQSSHSRDGLAFVLGGRLFEFTASEFAVVTGLGFNRLHATPSSSIFHNLIFDGRHDLRFDDVRNLFLAECKARRGMGEVCLKLGLVVIIYGIILYKAGPNNIIDNTYIHLLDDLVSFDRFPWGRIAFDHLVESTKAIRDRHCRLLSNGISPEVEAPGYSFALQVWAYEVMPRLGRMCDNRILGWESMKPRVMRWSPISTILRTQIEELFSSLELEVSAPIHNLSTDKQLFLLLTFQRSHSPATVTQLCFDSPVQQFHTGLNLIKRKLSFTDPREVRRCKSVALPKFDIGHCIVGNPSDVGVCSSKKRTVNTKRTIIMKSAPPNRLSRKDVLTGGMTKDGQTGSQRNVRNDDEQFPTLEELVMQLTGLQVKVRELKDMMLKLKMDDAKNDTATRSPVDVPTEVQQISSSTTHESSFEFAPCKKKRTGGRLVLLDEDIIDSGTHEQARDDVHPMFNQFLLWYRNEGLHKDLFNIPIPTLWSVGVSRPWFDTLLNPHGWLADEHMDAMMSLIVIQSRLKEMAHGGNMHSWAVVDTACWEALKQPVDHTTLYELAMLYVRGSRPSVGANAWVHVEKIYGFGHVHGTHWLCYEIAIQEQRITVYDSRSKKLYWPVMLDELKDFAINIPWLLRRLNENVIKNGNLKRKWDVVQYKHPPQQLNKSDCGVMTLEYLKCLLSGTPIFAVNRERAGDYRKTCCGQLFEYILNLLGEREGQGEQLLFV